MVKIPFNELSNHCCGGTVNIKAGSGRNFILNLLKVKEDPDLILIGMSYPFPIQNK
jgi:hypothetical protein